MISISGRCPAVYGILTPTGAGEGSSRFVPGKVELTTQEVRGTIFKRVQPVRREADESREVTGIWLVGTPDAGFIC